MPHGNQAERQKQTTSPFRVRDARIAAAGDLPEPRNGPAWNSRFTHKSVPLKTPDYIHTLVGDLGTTLNGSNALPKPRKPPPPLPALWRVVDAPGPARAEPSPKTDLPKVRKAGVWEASFHHAFGKPAPTLADGSIVSPVHRPSGGSVYGSSASQQAGSPRAGSTSQLGTGPSSAASPAVLGADDSVEKLRHGVLGPYVVDASSPGTAPDTNHVPTGEDEWQEAQQDAIKEEEEESEPTAVHSSRVPSASPAVQSGSGGAVPSEHDSQAYDEDFGSAGRSAPQSEAPGDSGMTPRASVAVVKANSAGDEPNVSSRHGTNDASMSADMAEADAPTHGSDRMGDSGGVEEAPGEAGGDEGADGRGDEHVPSDTGTGAAGLSTSYGDDFEETKEVSALEGSVTAAVSKNSADDL